MASTPVSQIIFFIAALVISSTVAAVLITSVEETSSVFSKKSRSLVDTMKDDITILNDPNNVSTNPLIIYIKNTGESTVPLQSKMFDVFIDGDYQDNYSITSMSGNSELEPTDVAKFSINGSLSSGSHTLRIYVRGKEWDEMKFRI